MKIRVLTAVVSLAAMTACQADITTNTKLSELMSGESFQQTAELAVEVAACSSYEDSREISSSVREAQNTIPTIFEDAEYRECFRQNFESFALFDIPLLVSTENQQTVDYLTLTSGPDTPLSVQVPESVVAGMERVRRESFGVNTFDLAVGITLENDTDDTFNAEVLSAFVDDRSVVHDQLEIPAGSSTTLQLSDVSVSHALEYFQVRVLE